MMCTPAVVLGWLVAMAVPASVPRVMPATATSARAPAPWAVGVDEYKKTRALALLEAGVARFDDKAYQEALQQFRAALREWDHPAIHFNMVRALVLLDRPLEAYDHVVRALAYGAAALDAKVHAEALSYHTLLEGQIATVTVSCREPGVRVTLDGQLLVRCPDTKSRWVTPGSHQVVATRHGLLASTRDVLALPRKTVHVSIEPIDVEDVVVTTHRWARWKPWALSAAGAALGFVGGYYELQARGNRREYDRLIKEHCSIRTCDPERLGFARLYSDARRDRAIAIGAFSIGGAALVTGLAAVVLNGARRELPADFQPGAFSITPAPGGGTLRLQLPF